MARRGLVSSCLAALLATGLVAVPLGGASAQTGRLGSSESARVYTAVEPAMIVELLEEAGFEASIEAETDDSGARDFVIIGARDGFVMGVNLRACDRPDFPRGCLGLNFFTLWDVKRGQLRQAREAATVFNEETFYGRLQVVDADQSVFFSHYMIVDHGVTRDNVAANLDLFMAMCSMITDEYMDDILDLGEGGGASRGK